MEINSNNWLPPLRTGHRAALLLGKCLAEMEVVWDEGGHVMGFEGQTLDDFGVNLPKRCKIWSLPTGMLVAKKKCQETCSSKWVLGSVCPTAALPSHSTHHHLPPRIGDCLTKSSWSVLHREHYPFFLLDITKSPWMDGVSGLRQDSSHEDPVADAECCQLWH